MALQIANPNVVQKIHELSRKTGMTKTAAVEHAVDQMLKGLGSPSATDNRAKILGLLEQFDRARKRSTPESDILWDEFGLPK